MRYLFAGLALGACLAAEVQADFAPVAMEKLVDDAAVIVQGKVTKVEGAGFMRNGRAYDAAVVQVTVVLKGDPKLKEVRIAQPGAGGLAVSTDIRFKKDQEGIWLLTKQKDAKGKEAEVYWALHPSQFQPAKEKDAIAKLVKDRANKDKK